jgi:hypothetical protein
VRPPQDVEDHAALSGVPGLLHIYSFMDGVQECILCIRKKIVKMIETARRIRYIRLLKQIDRRRIP